MSDKVTGIHHVTAISSDAQRNVEFYAGILGLKLVKRTVNFDAPGVHHLYYGDETGTPGTILTFFPYEGSARGRRGKGQLTVIMFSIPKGSLDYWLQRFAEYDVVCDDPAERFGNEVHLSFEDHDGLCMELVETDDPRPGNSHGPVAIEHGIRGLYGVTMSEDGYERTAGLLSDHLGHHPIREAGGRFRYSATGRPGDMVDIVCRPQELRAIAGSGTVHHLAFATPDDKSQLALRERLLSAGLNVTEVMDRQYFRSIYFREPGGVLFEIATEPPGFAIDESSDNLGTALKLPPWLEPDRERIEKELRRLEFDIHQFRD